MAGGPSTPGVSGPGALSRRTDRGPAQKLRDLPDAQYGEAATYRDLQQQAPLAQSPAAPQATRASAGRTLAAQQGASVTPLHAPTQSPSEPVTAGAAAGPGPGPEALNLAPQPVTAYASAAQALQAAAATSQNPDLQWLAQRATEGRF